MRRRVERAIAENRHNTRQLESYEVTVDNSPVRSISLTGAAIEVDVSAEVYTRPVGDTMLFGHPDEQHGIGRGGVGDNRDGWTLEESLTNDSGEFTVGGRSVVADALEAVASGGLDSVVVGSGSTIPSMRDASLESVDGTASAWGDKPSANETLGSGGLLFHQHGDEVSEVGLLGSGNELMARLVLPTITTDDSTEVKVVITMEFSGDSTSTSAVTEDGVEAIADSVESPSVVVGLSEIGIGTGSAQPQSTDSSLDNEVGRKGCNRTRLSERVRAYTKWYQNEPVGQPFDVTEMGVFDNSGRLVVRSVFDGQTIGPDYAVSTSATIRII